MTKAAGGDLRLVVSGLAQGDDPSGGLSVARCIRAAFPEAHITGMDYSVRGAALHDPVFDDVVIHRPWGEFETDALRAHFAEQLAAGALILSTIDLEAYWLAHHFPDTPAILSPGKKVFPSIAKPPQPAPALTDLHLPDTVHVSQGRQACHAFLRKTGFRAWLKGPFHDALRVTSWENFDATWRRLAKYWPFEGTLLQEDITGTHEAIAFAACEGCLVDAIWIVKNDMTTAGKTVAGSRRELSTRDRSAIEHYVRDRDWHGGGEIELIRDGADRIWLIEINARFPSWIVGAYLLGCNLPARLVAQHLGVDLAPPTTYEGFVRIHHEIPTRHGYRLLEPVILEPDEPLDAAKTAFNIHELARHLKTTIDLPVPDRCRPTWCGGDISSADAEWLKSILQADGPTPRAELNLEKLRARCSHLAGQASCDGPGPAVDIAYSMKTNPEKQVLQEICRAGLCVEVISQEEYDKALGVGFDPREVVVNGPGKSLEFAARAMADGATVFADSIEELQHFQHLGIRPSFAGVRLRPPEVTSRFGIPLSDPNSVVALMRHLSDLAPAQIGIHAHVPCSSVGSTTWRALMEAVGDFALTLRGELKVGLTTIDVGGGWYPGDLEPDLNWLRTSFGSRLKAKAPELDRLLVEPGRAIVQDCCAVVTSVSEIRNMGAHPEAVIDASLGELSEAGHFPHRIAIWDGCSRVRLLYEGGGSILGRTCMEDDVIASRIDLSSVNAGGLLAILDSGGYDRSMAYAFGKG